MTDEHQPLTLGSVVAHGIDVVDMADFARFVTTQAGNFLDRYFTSEELVAADTNGRRIERLASRFAIKEAVLKAIGTGWGNGIAFTDVEIVSHQTGAPSIMLHRRLAAVAAKKGIGIWLVSASHTSSVAMASVIALGATQQRRSELPGPMNSAIGNDENAP